MPIKWSGQIFIENATTGCQRMAPRVYCAKMTNRLSSMLQEHAVLTNPCAYRPLIWISDLRKKTKKRIQYLKRISWKGWTTPKLNYQLSNHQKVSGLLGSTTITKTDLKYLEGRPLRAISGFYVEECERIYKRCRTGCKRWTISPWKYLGRSKKDWGWSKHI